MRIGIVSETENHQGSAGFPRDWEQVLGGAGVSAAVLVCQEVHAGLREDGVAPEGDGAMAVPAEWPVVRSEMSSGLAAFGLCLAQFVARVLISLGRFWQLDLERSLSFIDPANRSRWKRHRPGRPSSTWEMSWARAFGAEWVAASASATFGDQGMQLIHSVHNAYGFPT